MGQGREAHAGKDHRQYRAMWDLALRIELTTRRRQSTTQAWLIAARGCAAARHACQLCRFQKTVSVVTRRALQHAGIGMLRADRAISIANQGGFRGPEAALAGYSDGLGRAASTPKAQQTIGSPPYTR